MKKKIILCMVILVLICTYFVSSGFREDIQINYEWKLTYEDNFDTFDKTNWINHHEAGNKTIWSNYELQW